MVFETKDKRKDRSPIARRKLTLTATSDILATEDVSINGELLNYIIDAPKLKTDMTYDFTMTNEDGETIYSNTGITDNISTLVLLSAAPIPMSGIVTFACSFTTSQTVEFDMYFYYK